MAGHDPARARRELPGPAGGVGVREPVEAEPAHPVALAPFARQRVGGRGGRKRRVEGGVEARDPRHVRQRPGDGVDGRKRLRLVKGGEGGQLPKRRQHLVVEPDRRVKALPAVHDAVPDDVRALRQVGQLLRRRASPQLRVVGVEQRQLEAARPGVGDEDPHARVSRARPSRARPASRRRARACRPGGAGARPPSAGAGRPPAHRAAAPGRSRPSRGGTGRGRSA